MLHSRSSSRQLHILMLAALGLGACSEVGSTAPAVAPEGALLAKGGNGKGNGGGGSEDPGGGGFTDEFEGFSTDRWIATEHALGRGWFRPQNVSASNGLLALTSPAGTFDGGEIRSRDKFGYGRYEARIKAAATPSSLTAFFLYQGNPKSNEIDVEIVNESGTWRILVTTWVRVVATHQVELSAGDFGAGFDPFVDFHTYAIDHRRGEVAFFVDGELKTTFSGKGRSRSSAACATRGSCWPGTSSSPRSRPRRGQWPSPAPSRRPSARSGHERCPDILAPRRPRSVKGRSLQGTESRRAVGASTRSARTPAQLPPSCDAPSANAEGIRSGCFSGESSRNDVASNPSRFRALKSWTAAGLQCTTTPFATMMIPSDEPSKNGPKANQRAAVLRQERPHEKARQTQRHHVAPQREIVTADQSPTLGERPESVDGPPRRDSQHDRRDERRPLEPETDRTPQQQRHR